MGRWEDILTGIDPVTGKATRVGVDSDHSAVIIENLVWDPILMDWVRMEQPQLDVDKMDLTVTMGDVEALLADSYWKRMQPYLHGSGKPKYIARNTDIDANLTDVDWYIWKYSDADIPTIEGPRIGAANSEAAIDALPWNT